MASVDWSSEGAADPFEALGAALWSGPAAAAGAAASAATAAQLREALEAVAVPGAVAAFDADGTLWRVDVSDDLLDYVDARGLIAAPEGSPGCRAHCDRLCATDRPTGYRYATAVYAGLPEATVAAWAQASWEARGVHEAHASLAALVRWLRGRGVRVVIVSASPVWAVLPGARWLGLDDRDVFAMDVEREGDRLTDRVVEPTTAGEGKVQRLQRELGHTRLALGCGNTVDDLPMIRQGAVRLLVDPAAPHGSARGLPDLVQVAGAEDIFVYRSR